MSLTELSPQAVEEREAVYLVPTYARTPFHPRSGRGSRLFDADGRSYWDLMAGIAVNVLGYNHPHIRQTLRSATSGLLHVSNLYYHPAQGALANRLIESSGLARVFFCNSGTEANEAALKFARLVNPGRSAIIALQESFHGRTIGALSVTGHEDYRTPFNPLLSGVTFVPPNDCAALASAASQQTSTIIMEPILGEGGVIPLTDTYLQAARKIANHTGAVLIFDEIQCGMGRTGEMFAFQQSGAIPDILTLAKALGGGLPLGAVVTGPRLEGLIKPGHHGTTFGGNPLACRLGLIVFDEIESPQLLERIRLLGIWFRAHVEKLRLQHPSVVDVRGRGLMWGIELSLDARKVAARLLARGFVVGTARENILRLLPPYVIPKSALASFLTALSEVLSEEEV